MAADFQSVSSLRIHASFGLQLCNILQAGHSSRKDMSGRDANLIVSVRSPVGTGVLKTGQRITISHITFEPSGSGQERKRAPAINGRGKLAEGGEKLEFSPTPSASLESRTLVSRSDPVPGLVRSRQRFVRRSQLLDHGNANHRRTKSAANDINQIN
jgi:hypothetical protein